MPIGIRALGHCVPPTVVDNVTISQWAETTPQWIEDRTGILQRRYAPPGTPTSALARAAVRDLLATNPDALRDVGAVIVATSTPDQPQPSTAAILERDLDVDAVMSFDLNAVCSGFVTALVVGAALAETPATGPCTLIIGADRYSTIMDKADRRTISLFGDGAGAAVLGPVPDGYGVQASKFVTHGGFHDYVQVIGGGTRCPLDAEALAEGADRFRMQGPAVRKYALDTIPELVRAVLADTRLTVPDIHRWIFHQGNVRLLEDLAGVLGIDLDRVPLTAPYYGNTGAASVALTLSHSHAQRPLARGDRVLLAALGGGMTAGAALLTWY